jgi:hypothetical protein
MRTGSRRRGRGWRPPASHSSSGDYTQRIRVTLQPQRRDFRLSQ